MDLNLCLAHQIPVNRCVSCWPQYLQYLGGLCWNAILEGFTKRRTA